METGSSGGGGDGGDDVHGLKFGKKIYFEQDAAGGSGSGSGGGGRKGKGVASGAGASPGASAAANPAAQQPRCQVEGCGVDLSGAKSYYCRYKVCSMHSKSPLVVVAGIEQRFSQQCIRNDQSRKGPSKPKLTNFSPREDMALVSCWINVSKDPIVGTGQRRVSFWRTIEQSYNEKKGPAYPTRTLRSLEGRWDFIKKQVTKFNGHHQHVLLENQSNHSLADQTVATISRYNALEKRPFAVPHCWEVLRNESKWFDLQDTRSNVDGTEGADLNGPIDESLSQSAHQSTDSASRASRAEKRPMGRDSAKAVRKRASSESSNQSCSEYASAMSAMCIQRMSYWKEADDEANVRLDKLVQIESERLAIKRLKEDERILAIDLEKCNPLQRRMYERMQEEIMSRWSRSK